MSTHSIGFYGEKFSPNADIICSIVLEFAVFETRHDKTCFCHMRTTKEQISLHIRAVWSAPLLFAAWIVQYFYLLYPKIQDSS